MPPLRLAALLALLALAARGASAARGPQWERNFKVFSLRKENWFGGTLELKGAVESMLEDFDPAAKPEDSWDSTWLLSPQEMSAKGGELLGEISTALVQTGHAWQMPEGSLRGAVVDSCLLEADVATLTGGMNSRALAEDPREWNFQALRFAGNCMFDITRRFHKFMRAPAQKYLAVQLVLELSYAPGNELLQVAGRRGSAVAALVAAEARAAKAQGGLYKAIDHAIEMQKLVEELPGDKIARKGYRNAMKEVNRLRKAAAKAAREVDKVAAATQKTLGRLAVAADRAKLAAEAAEASFDALVAQRNAARAAAEAAEPGSQAWRLARATVKRLDAKVARSFARAGKLRAASKAAAALLAKGGARAKNFVGRVAARVAARAGAKLVGRMLIRFVPILNLVGFAHDLYTIASVVAHWDKYEFGWYAGEQGDPSKMRIDRSAEAAAGTPANVPDGNAAYGSGDAPENPNGTPGQTGGGAKKKTDEDGHGGEGGGAKKKGEEEEAEKEKGTTGNGNGEVDTDGNERPPPPSTTTPPSGGAAPRPARPDEAAAAGPDTGGAEYTTQRPEDAPCTGAGGTCQKTTVPCSGGFYDAKAACGGTPHLPDRQCCKPYAERRCSHVHGKCVADAAACAALGDGFEAAADWRCAAAATCCVKPADLVPGADYSRTFARDARCSRVGGTCQNDKEACGGKYISYHCGGSGQLANRRCCLPADGGAKYTGTFPGDAKCRALKGRCQYTGLSCDGGSYTTGKCAGPADRACCVGATPAGTKSGGEGGGRGGGIGKTVGVGTTGEHDADGKTKKSNNQGGKAANAGGGDTAAWKKDYCAVSGGWCLNSGAAACESPRKAQRESFYCHGKAACCLTPEPAPAADDDGDKKGEAGQAPAPSGCPAGRSICVRGALDVVKCAGGAVSWDEAKLAGLLKTVSASDGTTLRVLAARRVEMDTVSRDLATGAATAVIFGVRLEWRLEKAGPKYTGAVKEGDTYEEPLDYFWVAPKTCRGGRHTRGLSLAPLRGCVLVEDDALVRNPSCPATLDLGLVHGSVVGEVNVPYDAEKSAYSGTISFRVSKVIGDSKGVVLGGQHLTFKVGHTIKLPVALARNSKVAE